jgi:2-polyprenyl-3-methyl-5-hydroxy-6-metoxy-1,4-benzoquinol methylase
MPAPYATLEALATGIEAMGSLSPEYWDRMMHPVPVVPCIDRADWLLKRLAGKTVLHLGCVGPLHEGLLKVCTRVYGIDLEPLDRGPGQAASYPDYVRLDLDDLDGPLPVSAGVQAVLLGEVLEHLTMPGLLLRLVREAYPGVEVLISVPNAAADGLRHHLARGYENVHTGHMAWYSWKTLTTLVERCGFAVQEWYWCGEKPLFAEGLLMVVR